MNLKDKLKKYTEKQLKSDGFAISYYDGYCIDLKIPEFETREEHDNYAKQKIAYINKLGTTK